jgi:hypothetical protein
VINPSGDDERMTETVRCIHWGESVMVTPEMANRNVFKQMIAQTWSIV